MFSPEYILNVFSKSVRDFKPTYIQRFTYYTSLQTTFPTKQGFFEFYTHMLLQAKERHVGNLILRIEPDFPTINKGFIAYNYYDTVHLHPVFWYEVSIEENIVTVSMRPI